MYRTNVTETKLLRIFTNSISKAGKTQTTRICCSYWLKTTSEQTTKMWRGTDTWRPAIMDGDNATEL